MKSLLIICCLTFCAVGCIAQQFSGEAPLPEVNSSGFYKVLLPPDVSRYLANDFANLRIFTGAKPTPYFLQNDASYTTSEFTSYKIVKHEVDERCCTTVVFERDAKNVISNFNIRIKNADVSKIGTLSGSDDLKSWYSVKGYFYFSPVNNPNGTTELRNVDIPLSDYRYYSLRFWDSLNAPLKIESVGYYKHFIVEPTYQKVSIQSLQTTHDEQRQVTSINILMDTSNWIDRISFKASGAPYFLRETTVKRPQYVKSKGKEVKHYEILHQQKISSDREIILELPSEKLAEVQIEILNNDDAPLQINDVSVWQKSHYAIVWLDAGAKNKIIIEKANASAPKYDIVNFKKNIPADVPQLIPGSTILFSKPVESQTTKLFGSKNLMWIGIVGIIMLLGILSVRLIREAKAS